jgi:hypothetical protein
MIKQLALEKIQDEYDLAAARKFEDGIKDSSVTIRPYEELIKKSHLSLPGQMRLRNLYKTTYRSDQRY